MNVMRRSLDFNVDAVVLSVVIWWPCVETFGANTPDRF